MSSPVTVELPDEDRAFFDSLIPTIKTFTADQKLDFRSEVLNIVRRMKRQSTTCSIHIPCLFPSTHVVPQPPTTPIQAVSTANRFSSSP